MAFNGSGVFVRLYTWVNDAAANIKIRADRMDNEFGGIATALSTCLLKDGTQTLTANLPFNGKKITGYGSSSTPSARTDVPSLGQVEDGTLNWVAAGGTADVITATYSVPITALIDGQECKFRASAANATTTPTFSPNSLTARTITKVGGTALKAGDIPAALAEVILRYNLANTRWELVNPRIITSVVGTITNDSAAAGLVGEYISSEILVASAVSLSSTATSNVTSISLTAGDWDVRGNVSFNPAGTTTIAALIAGISQTTATQPTPPGGGAYSTINATLTTGGAQTLQAGTTRISLSATTTIYLTATATFAVSTMGAYGFIGARRVR